MAIADWMVTCWSQEAEWGVLAGMCRSPRTEAGLGVRARTGVLSGAPASSSQAVAAAAGPAGSHRGSRTCPQGPLLRSRGAPPPWSLHSSSTPAAVRGPVPHLGDSGLPGHPEKTGHKSGHGFYWRRLCHSLSWQSRAGRAPPPGSQKCAFRGQKQGGFPETAVRWQVRRALDRSLGQRCRSRTSMPPPPQVAWGPRCAPLVPTPGSCGRAGSSPRCRHEVPNSALGARPLGDASLWSLGRAGGGPSSSLARAAPFLQA